MIFISTKTPAEFAKEQQKAAWAKQVSDALQLLDLTNIPSKSYTTYSKESLRSYLKNPLSDSNSKNLRKLSQYLFVLNEQYRRIIFYYAGQLDLSMYNVVPNVSLSEDNDDEKILQDYENTLKLIDKMNLQGQIYSILVSVLRDDVFYGYIYYDESSPQDINSCYILPLDPDYCKISSVNYDGTLNIAFDFSYFDSASNSVYLEYWDKSFQTMYDSYKNDRNLKWQELDPERSVCFKFNYDQTDRVIPPFASLFEDVINLTDLRGITSVQDELSIYKLLVAKIDTLSNTNEVNDFAVDLETCVDFYNKMVSTLPDSIGMVLSPMDITPVSFDKDATDVSNSIANANKNLFEAAGCSQIMNGSNLTGSTAVTAALRFNYLFIQKPVLWQIEARVNRFLDYVIPDNSMRIRYLQVSPYLKEEAINKVKDAASLGVPVKTQLASLLGVNPLDMNSMLYLENNILKLQDKMIPVQSSYTQSGTSETISGGQTKDLTDLTDDGEASRDKREQNG